MADTMQHSTGSLSDAYDMVDDISDLSSDDHDHDTVSLASTEQADDDGVDDGGQDGREDSKIGNSPYDQIASILDDLQSLPTPVEQGGAAPSAEDVDETPRQSTITVKALPKIEHGMPDFEKPTYKTGKPECGQVRPRFAAGYSILAIIFGLLIWISTVGLPFLPQSEGDVLYRHNLRKHQLSVKLAELHYTNVNLTHLLPEPRYKDDKLQTIPMSNNEVRFQQIAAGSLLISLPNEIWQKAPVWVSLKAYRGNETLAVNTTNLMPGIYIVTVANAFGLVTLRMSCTSPRVVVYWEHDFGQPIVHAVRALAERVHTDLQQFLDRATSSAQRITRDLQASVDQSAVGVKDAAAAVKTELRRDVKLSRERALAILFNFRSYAQTRTA